MARVENLVQRLVCLFIYISSRIKWWGFTRIIMTCNVSKTSKNSLYRWLRGLVTYSGISPIDVWVQTPKFEWTCAVCIHFSLHTCTVLSRGRKHVLLETLSRLMVGYPWFMDHRNGNQTSTLRWIVVIFWVGSQWDFGRVECSDKMSFEFTVSDVLRCQVYADLCGRLSIGGVLLKIKSERVW